MHVPLSVSSTDIPRVSGLSDSSGYDPGEIVDIERVPPRLPVEKPPVAPGEPGRAVKSGLGQHTPVPKGPLNRQNTKDAPAAKTAPAPSNELPPPSAVDDEEPEEAPELDDPETSTATEDDLEAFLASSTRTVEEAGPTFDAIALAMAPKPIDYDWSEQRPFIFLPALDIGLDSDKIEAFQRALLKGNAQAVHVEGFGSTLGDRLYSIFTSAFPHRIYERHPRLTRKLERLALTYLWTGQGVVHEGAIWLMVIELNRDAPTSVILVNPQTLF